MTSFDRANLTLNIVDYTNINGSYEETMKNCYQNEITFYGNKFKRVVAPIKGYVSSYKSSRVKIWENDRLTVDTTVTEFCLTQREFGFNISDTMYLYGIRNQYDKEYGHYDYIFKKGRSYRILVRAF